MEGWWGPRLKYDWLAAAVVLVIAVAVDKLAGTTSQCVGCVCACVGYL